MGHGLLQREGDSNFPLAMLVGNWQNLELSSDEGFFWLRAMEEV